MLISIHDKTLQRVSFLDNDKPNTLHFQNDVWHRYLTEASSTFDFTVPKDGNTDVSYLTEKNYVSFHYNNKDYLFNIMKTEETETELTCYCENLNLELINEISPAYEAPRAMTFKEYFENSDIVGGQSFSDLVLGINEVSDYTRTLKWDGTDTKLARLLSLVNKFDAECEFITELNRDGTLNRIVLNVYKKHDDNNQGVGTRRQDVTLYYGKQIDGVRRTVDKTELYSAIYPIGKDGLTISSISAKEYDEDGNLLYFTDSGSNIIYAPQTAEEYPAQVSTTGDKWILYRWDYDTDNVNTLYGQSLAKLKEISVPALTYEIEGDFLLDIGDTVTIYDDKFTPTLILEARVSEQEVSFTDPTQNKNVFSNFKALESKLSDDITSRLDQIIQDSLPYSIEVLSDNGIIFKNDEGHTTLTARVLKGNKDVTSEITVKWSKDGTFIKDGISITINASDVLQKALYNVKAVNSSGDTLVSFDVTVIDVSDGKGGEDGVGVSQVIVEYALASSDTTPPDSGWSETRPDRPSDQFLWERTTFVYTDGNRDQTLPVCITGDKGDKGEQGERGLQGLQGEKGEQGIPGQDGTNGKTTYFHIKYSDNANGNPMTETPSTYIGTYVDFTETDSSDYRKYTWARFEGVQGVQGEQGIPGKNGENGQTSYLHIAYANSSDGSQGFSTTDSTDKLYIGQYTDFIQADSSDYTKYSWSKIKGDKGDKGEHGDKGDKGDPGQKGDPGEDGVSITQVQQEFYLSTSSTSAQGGTWTTTCPAYRPGFYYWTRWKQTFSDGAIKYTTAVYDSAFTQAYIDAESAQSTADGKNTIYYQASMPTGGTYKANDMWFDTDGGYKPYRWNGSAWTAFQFDTEALAAGSVTASQIAAGAVNANKIDVNELSAITANLGVVNAGLIQSGNYVQNKTGTLIDLEDGSINTKNFNVDTEGNVSMTGTLTMQGAQSMNIKNDSASLVGTISFKPVSGQTWSPGALNVLGEDLLYLVSGDSTTEKAFIEGYVGGYNLFEMAKEQGNYGVWIGTSPLSMIGVNTSRSPNVYAEGCTKTIDFDVVSGFSKASGELNNIVYNSMGKFCLLSFSLTGNVQGGTHTKVLTVPSGYRPPNLIFSPGCGGVYGWFQIKLQSDGGLYVWHPTGMTSFRGTILYYL